MNPRIFAAVALCATSVMLAMFSFASTPPSGTLSEANPVLNYDAGPFAGANATPILFVDNGPECGPGQPCDSYTLNVNVSSTYLAANPGALAKVTLYWTDTGAGASDYDLYIYKGVVGDLDGSKPAAYQSASGANPEIASITPLVNGSYTIKVVPYTPSGETVHVKVELLAGSGGTSGFPGFGGADPTVPGAPRYQNFYAPAGTSAEPGSGEFNIGFNPRTGRIMTMNSGPIWRLTPPERFGLPECCEALWEDKSATVTDVGVDPILWTDQVTGRTFASNFTGGTTALYAYSDDDGDSWTRVGAGLPNAGADHQTIGTGNYPNPLPLGVAPNPLLNPKAQAVYYCSQDIVGPATCQRSDDQGASFAAGVLAYDGSQCQGLHGHVHVAPDGTAYLPVPDCNGKSGVAVSTDGGNSWVERFLPNSAGGGMGSDPSIAIDANNNLYFFNGVAADANGTEGHMEVQFSSDRGVTWGKRFDLGASHGLKNVAFPEAVGGDDGRAAVGFLGTDRTGNMQSIEFPGYWYLFIATTYDHGNTWTVVNATPNDPVQGKGGIWHGGGGNPNRNLLDFNEVTMDDKGRVLFGYSDGCVGDCVGNPDENSFVAHMRVARQSGGRTLVASQDPFTDTTTAKAPKAPCLTGTRDQFAAHLTWQAPDNGGAAISTYEIWRGEASGAETKIGSSGINRFDDTSADPAVARYYYYVKAVNSVGNGPQSNEINLVVSAVPPPTAPYSCTGTNVVVDASGDARNPAVGGAGPTNQADITAISFAADSPATTIKATMTLANLTDVPSPGTSFTTYYIVWDSANAKTYAARVNISPGALVTYAWGEFDKAENKFVTGTSKSTTGAYKPGVNGTISVNVPVSGVGSPTIPITDVTGTPAVRSPYGVTIAGEGLLGSGLVYAQPMDRAPNTGSGQSWAVCPPPNAAPTAVLGAEPISGTAPLTVTFDGSRSYDPDAGDSIASYTFDFGDGKSATSATPTVSHVYASPGAYRASLSVTDSHGAVSTNNAEKAISATPPQPDLIVLSLVSSNNQAKQGDKVTFTATIKNQGQGNANASNTEFKLDGTTVLGTPATGTLAPGATTPVSVQWLTTAKTAKGSHTIRATADRNGAVTESNEGNNTKDLTVFLQGNKTN